MYIEIAESWAEINKQYFDGGMPVSQSTSSKCEWVSQGSNCLD